MTDLTDIYSIGPGLAIRVLCANMVYMEPDFYETSLLLKILTNFSASVNLVGNNREEDIHNF